MLRRDLSRTVRLQGEERPPDPQSACPTRLPAADAFSEKDALTLFIVGWDKCGNYVERTAPDEAGAIASEFFVMPTG